MENYGYGFLSTFTEPSTAVPYEIRLEAEETRETYRFRDFRNSRDGVTPEEEFLFRGATVARVAIGPEEGFKADSAAIVFRDANGTEVRVTFPEKYLRYAYVVATTADPVYPEDRNRFDVDPGRTS